MIKKKLLFYTETSGIGGAEKYLNLLYSNRLIENYDIKVIVVTDRSDLDFSSYYNNYDVFKIFFTRRRYYVNWMRILFSITKYFKSADIIHFNKTSPASCVLPILFSLFFRHKIRIATEHIAIPVQSKYFFKPYITGFFIKVCSKLLDKTIVVCKASKHFFVKYYGYSPHKTFIIYSGVQINTKNNSFLGTELRSKIQIKTEKILSIIGRVVPQKNHIDAIRVLKTINSKGMDLSLLILGDANTDLEYTKNIKEFIESNSLKKNVFWIPQIKDISDVVRLSDVILLPSLCEEVPNVIKEAGLLYRVTAAYNVGGVGECIIDGETGIIVESGDYNALADKIIYFLNNIDFRKRLENNIYIKVTEMFNNQEMIDRTFALYANK